MANTYVLISSSTVGSGGAASITLSSIPATYTDLVLKISDRTNRSAGNDQLDIKLNGTSFGTVKRLYGSGTAAASDTTIYALDNANTSTANTFSNIEMYVPNYASANYKSASIDGVQEDNATTAYQTFNAELLSSTSAVTSIVLTPVTGAFMQYSTAYLYGIKNS